MLDRYGNQGDRVVDYGEMRRTIQLLNDRASGVDEVQCPKRGCSGVIRRLDGRFVCDRCSG